MSSDKNLCEAKNPTDYIRKKEFDYRLDRIWKYMLDLKRRLDELFREVEKIAGYVNIPTRQIIENFYETTIRRQITNVLNTTTVINQYLEISHDTTVDGTLLGSINGSNKDFIMQKKPSDPSKIRVAVNGLLQPYGKVMSVNYKTIILKDAPHIGDVVEVWYKAEETNEGLEQSGGVSQL